MTHRAIRKVDSAPNFASQFNTLNTFMTEFEDEGGEQNNDSPETKTSPLKLLNQPSSDAKKDHHPHKYYNFPVRGAPRPKRSNVDVIPETQKLPESPLKMVRILT